MASKLFPRGAVAAGNGDLIQVTSAKIDCSNGAKLEHTLREDAVGVSFGNVEFKVSFDFHVPEEGMERDYFDLVSKKRTGLLRIKIPKKTMVFDGAYSSVNMELPQDGAIKGSAEFIGKMTYNGK